MEVVLIKERTRGRMPCSSIYEEAIPRSKPYVKMYCKFCILLLIETDIGFTRRII